MVATRSSKYHVYMKMTSISSMIHAETSLNTPCHSAYRIQNDYSRLMSSFAHQLGSQKSLCPRMKWIHIVRYL